MAVIETGRIVVKKNGKNAGKKAVVLSVEKNLALVDGPSMKRRKVNVRHLFPLKQTLSVSNNTSHEEVVK
ncbi:MAG: 50S ribosomal protein L14e, partial [Candidatus Diapherotrites archaeon]|nr:50S ribosomal protein L14e [Candidatus Diapherotrites archaeon]